MNGFSAQDDGATAPGRSCPARGFTLVELLVVITIIGLLATLSMAALHQGREAARVSRTKALIAKIDSIIMQRYASYQTRRIGEAVTRVPPQTPPSGLQLRLEGRPRFVANRRLNVARDIMRLEMPQRWQDVIEGPIPFPQGIDDNGDGSDDYDLMHRAPVRPALSMAYRRQLIRLSGSNPPTITPVIEENESAECLYMIVTMGAPESRGQFHESEIGDVDGDGAREFIDGWGNPIRFLRWAPGFTETDVQAVVGGETGSATADMNMTRAVEAVEADYDPFDPGKVDRSTVTSPGPDYPPRSWRLIPLVYSAGPDGIYDILKDEFDLDPSTSAQFQCSGNPFFDTDSAGSVFINRKGLPDDTEDGSGSFDHYDNITNHRIEAN